MVPRSRCSTMSGSSYTHASRCSNLEPSTSSTYALAQWKTKNGSRPVTVLTRLSFSRSTTCRVVPSSGILAVWW